MTKPAQSASDHDEESFSGMMLRFLVILSATFFNACYLFYLMVGYILDGYQLDEWILEYQILIVPSVGFISLLSVLGWWFSRKVAHRYPAYAPLSLANLVFPWLLVGIFFLSFEA